MDNEELTPCYQALSLMEAKFIADQLNAEGIKAISDGQDMQDFLGPWEGNPRVYVRRVDIPRAEKWLAEYEKNRKRHADEDAARGQ
ncbi:hypothetical protein [Tautonia sociabilis]|uniref:DUF2007 domain-containing protein n=1 Tax=Tautonia sociabilis TaxID=2080755 RepID=A0A432MP96_9BACT|nr:hypothetical protein [Tautonia sociabilis]RUL89261.1 hypothetical protein TsocGM_02250 [Tautonia sociabilis]